MRTPCFRPVLLGATLLLTACIAPDQAATTDIARWSVDPQPLVLIGGNSPLPGHELFEVVGATRLSDGRIVIANSGSSEIRIFAPDGTLLTTAGGRGSGPGELRSMWGMARLDGDTLLVSSLSPGLTRYTGDGQFIQQRPIPYERVVVPCMSFESGIGLLPDGSLLLIYETMRLVREGTDESRCPVVPTDGLFRGDGLVARFDLASHALDTLAVLPGTERDGGNWRPYGRELLAAGGSNHIVVGESGSDSLLVFAPDGPALGVLPVPFDRRVVPDSAKTQTEEVVRTRSGRTLRWDLHYPDLYPYFARLLVDEDDLVWVMAYPVSTRAISSYVFFNQGVGWVPTGGAFWRVLDADGRVRAELTTPEGVFPLEIGHDYILSVQRDSLRVESVGLYRLRRSAP
jgi:hypothetical protein